MERTVPFTSNTPNYPRTDEIFAQHVEPFENGLTAVVTSSAYFSYEVTYVGTERTGRIDFAKVDFLIKISHFGTVVATVEVKGMRFDPTTTAKIYIEHEALSVGSRKIVVGFAGKSKSRRKLGWLPKSMLVKIEAVK
jgi:hypothetical protein